MAEVDMAQSSLYFDTIRAGQHKQMSSNRAYSTAFTPEIVKASCNKLFASALVT